MQFPIIFIFLALSLSFSPFLLGTVHAAQAPPLVFTYQGRLADNGGNLLGGAGTTYHFKFSIWNSPTVGGGSRLWPVGGPTSVAATVKQGVFTVNIGDTANGYPDALNLDFSSSANFYLQVEVSSDGVTFETLSPRQQITSAAFAQVAGAVVGATTPSVFGTTTPAANSFVTIAATSTNSIPLTIVGFANQVANLFRVASSTGESIFTVAGNGNAGVGTAAPNRKFDVLETNSVPQLRLSKSSSVYGEFSVDSAGDIHLSSPGGGIGGNVRMDTQNLWVCSGIGCATDATPPTDQGNIILENSFIFDNGFKFKQDAASTTMYDAQGDPILQFDDGQ